MSELRPILVKLPDHSKPTREFSHKEVKAKFHGWGICPIKGCSVAIVELDDGSVEMFKVDQVRFVEK